jgi:hypothetical protein
MNEKERERRATLLHQYLLDHGYEMRGEDEGLSLINRSGIYKIGSGLCIPGSANLVRDFYEMKMKPITQKAMRDTWGPHFLSWLESPF